jgi:hypothetical protein
MSGINLIVGCEVNAYNCESVRARCPGLIVAGGMQGMHFSVNEQCRLFSVLCIGQISSMEMGVHYSIMILRSVLLMTPVCYC